ncbi:hypothetical protein H0H93_001528, partial [Arthromyces matolae]
MRALDRRGKASKYNEAVVDIVPAIKKERELGPNMKEIYYTPRRYINGKLSLLVSPEVEDGKAEKVQARMTAGLIANIAMLYHEETPAQIKNRVQTACRDGTG